VVIPTIPENEFEIPSTLRRQTIGRYEVIVVSDASIDRCEARNRGMECATADIVAQTDDDCRPPEKWLERVHAHFERDPELVLLAGRLDKHRSGPHQYVGANLAYLREEALDVGGFDSELAGWRADTDFGWRMEITYGTARCVFDPDLEIEHIGPLRTSVDRDLERKLRGRYPHRYFTYLHRPNVPFGRWIGASMARLYRLSPRLGEGLLTLYKACRAVT
jgi:glycosyltransferase involved in cell wall biosynthesis